MLAIGAQVHHNFNLARTAYEKAIQLGSPQTPLIKLQLDGMQEQFKNAPGPQAVFDVHVR